MLKNELLNDFVSTFSGLNKSKIFHDFQGCVKGEKVLLAFLFKSGGECSPGKLAEGLNVSAARVAAILKSLESRNYIERTNDGDDKRRILVKLTEKGFEFVEELENKLMDHAVSVFDKLGENDSLEFIRLIKKITGADTACEEKGSDDFENAQ